MQISFPFFFRTVFLASSFIARPPMIATNGQTRDLREGVPTGIFGSTLLEFNLAFPHSEVIYRPMGRLKNFDLHRDRAENLNTFLFCDAPPP